MKNQIMMVDATAGQSKEELDAQLVSTLREIDPHNYPYLFERCKSCNVNALQLRFFGKDQIHELIPKTQLGILAEFEYLLSQWQISKGYDSLDAKIQLNRANDSNSPQHKPQTQSNFIIAKEKPRIPSNNQPVVVVKQEFDIKPISINLQRPQISSPALVADEPVEFLTILDSDENSNISNPKRIKLEEDDEEKFTLEIIVPELLQNLKNSYQSKNSLSTNERRLLCSSIVDYFVSRQTKFSSDTMDDLAVQIVEHFPTEDKKSWCNRSGHRTCGRFFFRFHNSRRKMKNTSTSNLTNSASSEDENDEKQFTLETIVPELLKELKDSYESKNSLTTNERRLLCSSIVDYFESRKIKFRSNIMEELAVQIVEHFPTEDKKSWCNRDGPFTSSRLLSHLRYSRKKMAKQTNNISTSNLVISSDNEDNEEQYNLETIVPELLKELKDSYESKNSLSTSERRLLCSGIVDYFVNRKIKFSPGTMDELAVQVVEHFPTEDKKSWCNRDGPRTYGRLNFRLRCSSQNMSKQSNNTPNSKIVTNSNSSEDENSNISNAKLMKFDKDDAEEQFTLEIIIPELLKNLKDSYESKNSLSTMERRLLCSSIVDFFESRKIKFNSYTMDDLSEQIVEHFPTEDKKSWYNNDGRYTRGRLLFRRSYSRRNKQTKNISTSKAVTNSNSSEEEYGEEKFTLETIIPELLIELKESYESKDFLSPNERSFLCSSIVDYFQSRKIKFRSDIMEELAVQIVEHFPTEDKKSWCNRSGSYTRGRFFFSFHNSRRNIPKQTNNTSSSTHPRNSGEDENDEEKFTLEIIVPELLKDLKDSYESKNSLTTNERHFLCSSIVDYFQSRKIKFSSDIMDDLAEQIVLHFPTEDKKSWCNLDGRIACGRLYFRLCNSRKNTPKETNYTSTSKLVASSNSSEEEYDEEQYTLEAIIPDLLKELKDSYEPKNSLSINERRLLCSSIVDYFESRKIKFSSYTMDDLAEQIVEHFPTEDKKSWYNRDGPFARGRLYFRLRNSRRNILKQTNNTSTSKVVTNCNSSEDEDDEDKFTLETIVPELLKDLKISYESKDSLSANERSFLCSSIVDYFESRKIKFSSVIMDELAEQIVKHFPTEDKKSWCNRDGPRTHGRLLFRLRNSRSSLPKQTSNTFTANVTLETIVPELLKELKDSYESNNSLSTNERRLLCSSIVDYFESRKIKFSSDAMDNLAGQIVEHFPTEDKKSWCNRDGSRTCGRFYFRIHYVRRNTPKETNYTFTSKITLETIIPEVLKELKDSYESKNSLSINEHRLLCSSIVDFFMSRKIKFTADIMEELAEQISEHFPTEDKKTWCNRDGMRTIGRFYSRVHYIRRNLPKQTNYTPSSKIVTNSNSSDDENSKIPTTKRMKFNEDDEEQFTLETIIPELLMELKDSYESKNSLSTDERRLLCNSIVCYFQNRKSKFSSYTMADLAEQIVEHFPTEDKKSWFNDKGSFRLNYVMPSCYKMTEQTNDTSDFKAIINSTSSEPESREEVHDEDSKSIQVWLKSHKCEDFSEIIDLWEDSMKYRYFQMQNLKDLKSIREFLNNWPSYKLEAGHELLTMDFEYLYPQAMQTFRTRWLVFKQNIEQFLKVELKDVNCIKLLEKYQLEKATINEDSSSCILIYLVHAITKPLRHFEAVGRNVSYAITDSQQSMMCLIRHKAEIDAYTEPYPCIFLVGDSLLDVQECYVVFMDLCYKLSYENCLAVCVQIFTILKVEDPLASQCFWKFIRGYMFNIAKGKEKFNLETENMVNYLETAASSI